MERLDLSQKPEYALEESAIHCARYANILHLVKDKVVLDIACGEGYGAALLKKAGAKRVVAVDISAESIETAKKLFGDFGVEYLAGDANSAAELCGVALFDVVISIETIEHIKTPETFLQSIKSTAKDDAIFYITCPNDYWYYPTKEQSNPFHIRKYTFAEFRELTTYCLGDHVQWGIGAAVFGFGTVPLEGKTFSQLGQSWMEVNESETAINVLNATNEKATPENCSYFVGLWNAPSTNFSISVFPVSMDAYARMVEELESNVIDVLRKNQKENNEALDVLRKDNNTLSHELRKSRLLLRAIQAENEALRQSLIREQSTISMMRAIQAENEALRQSLIREQSTISMMEVPYYRYLRLAKIIPRPVKSIIIKIVRFVKG